jgi:hydrogenase maturation protease
MNRLQRQKVLVLGYGNPGRQDDGLGPAAAGAINRLGWPNLTTLDNYQLNIEDALEVAAHDVVWFVDAARVGDAPFSITEVSPSATVEFTSHLLPPAALLAIAQQYCDRAPPAFLLAIRGYEFEFVEALTRGGRENLRAALAMLTESIRGVQTRSPHWTAP